MRSDLSPTRPGAARAIAITALVLAAVATSASAANSAPLSASHVASAHPRFDPYSIPIPAMCQHRPSRLKHGTVDWGQDANGRYLGGASLIQRTPSNSTTITDPLYGKQRTVSSAGAVAAVPIDCTAGGVDWPETIGLYTRSDKLLASVYLGHLAHKEHASVTAISLTGNAIHAKWEAYEGAGFHIVHQEATFTLKHHKLVVSHFRTLK